ncbi:TPA: hypothetical protein DHW51_19635 [Candidatus Poribacteria bacterium]|nr:hypothetical protein [Candidatus Poribacteria bacterium]
MKTNRKRLAYHIVSIFVVVAMMSAVSVWAKHNPKKGPKELNGIKFIEQNMDQATKECDDGGRGKPEFVPTVRDGEPNLALMVGAKPSVSDQIADGGYCNKPHNPKGKATGRHCGVYINDGFYNNCRSWIGQKYPGWIQVDLGKIATINRIFMGSDHSQGFADRAATQFDVLVATDKADKDSAAASWKKAFSYNNKEKPIRNTTELKFAAVKGRYVRIHIIGPGGTRVDELEIYGGKSPLGGGAAVQAASKLTTNWGQIKHSF